MIHLIEYEFKKDSLGRKYALKVILKSGKRERIPYAIAHTRAVNLKSSRKAAEIKEKVMIKIKETGSGATYSEYKKMCPIIEKEIVSGREKDDLKPLTHAQVRGKAKARAIHDRTGTATRMRSAWVYRVVAERYKDVDTGEIIIECDSPAFKARGLKRDGNHFIRMCGDVQHLYDKIKGLDLCSIDGGACVVYYRKSNKEIINQFELGKGCGFSFDFTNYNHDDTEEIIDDGFNWI